MKRLVLIVLLAWLPGRAAWAQDFPASPLSSDQPPRMTASAVTSLIRVVPGGQFHVAVRITIPPDWFYYSPDPGQNDVFEPMAAGLGVQAGQLQAGQPLWPSDIPHHYDFAGQKFVNNGYQGQIVVFVPIKVPPDAAHGKYAITLQPAGQICGQDQCVPLQGAAEVTARVEVEVAQTSAANPQWTAELSEQLAKSVPAQTLRKRHGMTSTRPAGLASAPAPHPPVGVEALTVASGLGLAFLAGLILNVMPCVLPVVPIRILSIVQLAKESRWRYITLGLWFAAGIVLFFVILAGINVALRLAAQQAFDWGRHFQSQSFRIGMAMVIVAMAVNLFGAFTVLVPSGVANLGEHRHGGREYLASLGMGLMMAILATPCSFAILGTAFAWAQFQSLWLGSLGIVTIGLGMAAPHALLTSFPSLVRRLPKPGRWMELLKQSMGFVLLLVALWLISTVGDSESANRVAWIAAYAVVLAFCLWMAGSWVPYTATLLRKTVVRALAVALAVAAGFWMLQPIRPSTVPMQPFDPAIIAAARAAGRPVLIKFSAAWCLSCKVVEATVYDDPQVAAAIKAHDVLAVKGDVTTADAPANDLLYNQLQAAPPLSILYPPGQAQPIRLVGKFNKKELLQALDALKPARGKGT